MIYGRKRRTRILFSYMFSGGVAHETIAFDDYHGMSNQDIVDVRKLLEKKVGTSVVITNWKVLHERS